MTPKRRKILREMFGGRCAYCGCVLPEKGWHADHVEPVYRDVIWRGSTDGRAGRYVPTGRLQRPENERNYNYFPSCAPCNIDKTVCSLEEWRGWLQDRMINSMRERIANFRHAERFGRVIVNTEPLVFWFEKYRESSPQEAPCVHRP